MEEILCKLIEDLNVQLVEAKLSGNAELVNTISMRIAETQGKLSEI